MQATMRLQCIDIYKGNFPLDAFVM